MSESRGRVVITSPVSGLRVLGCDVVWTAERRRIEDCVFTDCRFFNSTDGRLPGEEVDPTQSDDESWQNVAPISVQNLGPDDNL